MEIDPTESHAKAIFLRLDPVLRILLATIERYKQLEDANASPDSIPGASSSEEKKISLLKSQAQLMNALRDELQTLIGDDPRASAALRHMGDCILLPLRAILQSYGSSTEDIHPSRRSLLWQCEEEAAKMLSALIMNTAYRLAPSEQVELLSLCTVRLSATVSLDHQETQLDRGEDHSKALLQCMHALVTTANDPTLIGSALDGELMARVVLLCITVLDQTEQQDQLLIVEVLNMMGALLDAVPTQNQWRSLFPGCTAALFRRILGRGKDLSKVTAQSIKCLSQLFSVTMMQPHRETMMSVDVLEQLQKLSAGIDSTEGKQDVFVDECNEGLPTLLRIVFGMLPTSPSLHVKSAAATFCRTFLLYTWFIWRDEKIQQSALQCCITLSNDLDGEVRENARQALDSFKTTPQWSEVGSVLFSTVLDIINELPSATRSLRPVEFQSKLQLAKGYMEICDNETAAIIGEAMLVPAPDIRLSLSSLFDVELEAQPTAIAPSSQTICYRFIRDHTIKLACDFVKAMGSAVGSKRACMLIDACVADLHESCVARDGAHNISWVHEWIGMTGVAENILVSVTEMEHAAEKEQRRTRKRVKSLANALCPLLTSSPLWSLPTVFEPSNGNIESPYVSAETLRGNAMVVSLILRFVGTFVDFLASDISELFPVLLYPLFEKASKQNHSLVSTAALRILDKVVAASGCNTIESLISDNFDYLFGAMQARMRRIEQLDFDINQQLGGISSIARTILSTGLRHTDGERVLSLQRTPTTRNNVNLTIKTAQELISLFDGRVIPASNSSNTTPLLDLLEFYEGSLIRLLNSFGVTRESLAEDICSANDSTSEPWLDLLFPFECGEFIGVSDAYTDSPRDGSKQEEDNNIDITTHELEYLSLILSRCGYLISHPTLTVRIASCKVQTLAFSLLGFVAAHYVKPEDDESADGPSNAIYRQVSDSWPSISSRVDALSREFGNSQRAQGLSLHITKALPAPDHSSDVAFLSTLFDLVGAMAFISGSFIWRRLKEDIWPACARIVEAHLRSRTHETKPIDKTLLTGKDKLILSVFDLYKTVFRTQELAEKASRTIASVGATIIPFIGEQGPIGEAAMEALRAMLSVDSDALWRVLLSTSGEGLPPSPFQSLGTGVLESTAITRQHLSILQLQAKELIRHARSVPEQSLVGLYD